jgi:excisionase family DNA binding protein
MTSRYCSTARCSRVAWTASSDGRDPLARIRYLNTGAELDAVERATTTSPDPIDARNPIHPTPPAWTAAIVLTVQEAASVVKLTQRAIYGAIQRGDLVAYKPGGRLRINEKDLDAWLEATRVTPAASSPPPARMIPPPDLVTPSRRETSDGTLRARVRAQRRKRSAA